jgi:hypothetical protein
MPTQLKGQRLATRPGMQQQDIIPPQCQSEKTMEIRREIKKIKKLISDILSL